MNSGNVTKYVGAALFVALCLTTGFLLWKRIWSGPKRDSVQIENPLLLKQVDSLRDINGQLYAKLEQKVYTQAQVTHLLDSVAKALGIRVKTIKGIDRVSIQVDTVYRNLPVKRIYVYKGDSAYKVERHDGWNDILLPFLKLQQSGCSGCRRRCKPFHRNLSRGFQTGGRLN